MPHSAWPRAVKQDCFCESWHSSVLSCSHKRNPCSRAGPGNGSGPESVMAEKCWPSVTGAGAQCPYKTPLFHFHFCFCACNAPLCLTYFSVLHCLLLIFFLLPQLCFSLVLSTHSCSVCVSPLAFFTNFCSYPPWSTLSDPHPSGTLNNVRSSTTTANPMDDLNPAYFSGCCATEKAVLCMKV